MFSMKGIKNNHQVITKPSLKSVYMHGSNIKKETDKQGDSSSPSQHELNHFLTPKSELEHEPEFVLMRCIRCIFYVMVREGNPKCPNCHRSDALLDALPRDLPKPQENKDSSKKRKLNKSVYVAGNNKKKATAKQGDSQHELNHVLTPKSELEHEPEFILMRCINCIFYVMVREGNPKCPNCHKSDFLLDALLRDLPNPQENKDSSKKRNLNKVHIISFEMVSLKGIDKNCHVINEPRLKSVYVVGNHKMKEAEKQGDSSSPSNMNGTMIRPLNRILGMCQS
ncbi:hypothetical protein Hanom_Chr08g00698741 [Helianthus anomalus]